MFTYGVRAHDYGQKSADDLFSAIAADGFTCLQLAPTKALLGALSMDTISPQQIEEIKAAKSRHAIEISVLGCYVDPASLYEETRAKSVSLLRSALPLCGALGAGCVGTETTHMSAQPTGTTRKEALRALEHSLEEILPLAQALNVCIGIEPVYVHSMHSPQDTQRILRAMESKHLKVIFDPVNLLHTGLLHDQKSLWQRSMECFGDSIVAMHMKGVGINEDGALAPVPFGASLVDYPALFELVRGIGNPLPLLREEIDPKFAKEDLAFLQSL